MVESPNQTPAPETSPSFETIHEVVSKLHDPEIADRVLRVLYHIPVEAMQSPLQRKALQLIREHGIEQFEEICNYTTLILENGSYLEDTGEIDLNHHTGGGNVYVKRYSSRSIDTATKYLQAKGILEQK